MISQLQQACDERGITLTYTHLGVDWSEKTPKDQWEVVLHHQDKTSDPFEYFTGIGHRKLAPRVKSVGRDKWETVYGDVCFGLEDAIRKNWLRPQAPNVADVVSCLLSDSSACGVSFEEWASDFGYDSDSRKALATYMSCQENGDKLRKVLGHALMNELAGLEH